ncbi:MAG TPA: hypothetical protein VLH79_14710 [Chthonomonadales bacterium]|nr:hypothetical protein [Chthonomonadales bacterium]
MRRMVWLVAALAATVAAAPAVAQGGFGNLTPQQQQQLQAKMTAWSKWRENNKHVTALQQTVTGLALIEQDAKTALSRDQARKVLAAMNKWGRRPALTNEEARAANKELTAMLTVAQLQKLATAPSPGRGGRGFGGGARPGAGPGAGPGGGGSRPSFDISRFPDPRNYNPLNPDTLPFEQMRPVAKQRMNEFRTKLSTKAR